MAASIGGCGLVAWVVVAGGRSRPFKTEGGAAPRTCVGWQPEGGRASKSDLRCCSPPVPASRRYSLKDPCTKYGLRGVVLSGTGAVRSSSQASLPPLALSTSCSSFSGLLRQRKSAYQCI